MRKGPDFLIVGAPKCATTSLFHYLGQHPQVYTPVVKEPHYFRSPPGFHAPTVEHYFALFADKQEGQVAGEASTSYLFEEEAPQRIKALLGPVKIIALLRNPADRAFSHWQYNVNRGLEPLSFAEALAAEKERMASPCALPINRGGYPSTFFYFHVGLYYHQVKRYLEMFGRERVYVGIFEYFVRDPALHCQEIFRFLGIDPNFTPLVKVYNAPQTYRSKRLRSWLTTERPRWLEQLYLQLPQGVRNIIFASLKKVYWANMKRVPPRRLEMSIRLELLRRYEADIRELETLLQRDLSIWLADLASHDASISPR